MKRSIAILLLVFCAAASGAQQASPGTVNVDALGPQPGERVPDFSLSDQNGRTVTLKNTLGPAGAMLVFFRSADW